MNSLVEFRDVNLSYGAHKVLDDVNISIAPGEIVTVVGPNGSGKSSLLRALIGALKPSSGQIPRASGLRIGYVPPKLQIDPTLPTKSLRRHWRKQAFRTSDHGKCRGCPVASSNAFCSPAPCFTDLSCCFWTKPPKGSTSPDRRRSTAISRRCATL